MLRVTPVHEGEQAQTCWNAAALRDADRCHLDEFRRYHIPRMKGLWGEFCFPPGNLGDPVLATGAGRIGVDICYARRGSEGWWELGLAGAPTKGQLGYWMARMRHMGLLIVQWYCGASSNQGSY